MANAGRSRRSWLARDTSAVQHRKHCRSVRAIDWRDDHTLAEGLEECLIRWSE